MPNAKEEGDYAMADFKTENKKLNATFVNYRVTEPTNKPKGKVVVLKEGESFQGKFIKLKQEEGFSDQIWLLEVKENGDNVINSINAGTSIKKGLLTKNVQLQDNIKITFLRFLDVEKKGRKPYQVFVVEKIDGTEKSDDLAGL